MVLLEYTHEVLLDEYDVVIEAQDRNGRWRTFTLKVRFAGEVYFDEVRAYTGDYVRLGAEVEIRLSLARPVPVEDLDVRLIGAQGEWLPDLVLEALQIRDYPFGIAVHWHPEEMQTDPKMQALFRLFVEASLTYRLS